MRHNDELKLHFVNVNHGDATIIEFPDYGAANTAHFAVVDFGAKLAEDRGLTRDYLRALVDLREDNDAANFDYEIDFVCVTHPHNDHYGGVSRFMTAFADPNIPDNNKIKRFWDCGFRTNSAQYNQTLADIVSNDNLTFTRVAAGAEFKFGDTLVSVLAPSIDLRNRFDTYGVGKNNASVVLKIKYRNSYIILAGDAEFASWGKTTEEFPRMERIEFHDDAVGLAERHETSDQLRCNLLRVSHHGSMHGSSLEYLERLEPRNVVVPAGDQQWYQDNVPAWADYFPHSLVTETLSLLHPQPDTYITGDVGNIIFKYSGNWSPRDIATFDTRPDDPGFGADLLNDWH